MKGSGFRSSGDEWHLITAIHDGADGLILCVIDTQVIDTHVAAFYVIACNEF
jgi:hypothetical protein